MKSNKIFLYMVIHDLKHPTEAIISQLFNLKDALQSNKFKVMGLGQIAETL